MSLELDTAQYKLLTIQVSETYLQKHGISKIRNKFFIS